MSEKAWQRKIREQRAAEDLDADMFGRWWDSIDTSLSNATIRPISYSVANEVISKYEWLGNMGTTEESFGLECDGVVVGVVCFGRTAGSNAAASVFGNDMADKVMTLCRGACVHYAHPHSASYLISGACRMLAEEDTAFGFLAYSDTQAGEIGTVYQACGWNYTGMTNPTEKFMTPDGVEKDARLVSAYTRDRRNGELRYKRTRKEQKQIMIDGGYKFFRGESKHRYVGVYGKTKSHTRKLNKQLLYQTFDYPKRVKFQEGNAENHSEGSVQFRQLAPIKALGEAK